MAQLKDLLVTGPSRLRNVSVQSINGITETEISYLDGVTSNIQTQISTVNAALSSETTRATTAENDKVSKTATGVQTIAGGLLLGATSHGTARTGGIILTGHTNPLFGLQATGGTNFYLQATNDKLYLGPTSSNALTFDSTGVASFPKTLSITGLTTASGGLKTNIIQAPTTSGGTTYGVGSNGQILKSNGSTVYWASDDDTKYTLPAATSSTLGGVKVGSNISVSSGTISLTKSNVTAALGYTPPTTDTNTTYSAGTGISLSGTTFSNSGVRSISTGSSNGTISVNTNGTAANVSVKGLGTAAYTASTAYATAAQGTKADNALPKTGGNISGHIYLTGADESSSTGSTSQIVFGTSSNNHVVLSSNANAIVVNPTTSSTTNQIVLYLDKESQFPNGVNKATRDSAGNVISTTYMPKSGGTFTGNTVAYSSNRATDGGCLRNIEVRTSSATGTLQSTNKIIGIRK